MNRKNLQPETSKSILLLITDTQRHGGISRFNKNLIESLVAHRLEVLALNDSPNTITKGFGKNKLWFFVSSLLSIMKRPNVVIIGHVHLVSLCFFSYLRGVDSVVVLHGIEAWKPKVSVRRFLKYASRFWAVSKFTRQKFIDTCNVGSSRVDLIFNTLPIGWSSNKTIENDSKVILSIARLDKNEGYKGIDKTLKAVAALKEDMDLSDWQYAIVAHGTDLKRHKDLASQLKIDGMVHFYENVDDTNLKRLLSSCAMFILPSVGEGFGIVYLEAMSFKKAVLGALNSGAQDVIVDGKTGFLIDPSVAAIKERIAWLITNPEKRKSLGEGGYKHLNERFSFELFSQRINKLVSKCVV